MCFSATASFIAAGALVTAGAFTLHEAKDKSKVPIAAVPLLFGIQQATEGVIWLTGKMPWLQNPAAFMYVMFSHVLWPTYIPFAVMALEPPGKRKSVLKGFTVFGAALSIWLFWYVIHGPVSASLAQRCVVYDVNVPRIPYGLAAYVFVTCFACFISRYKFIRVFGIAGLGSLTIALWAYREAFYSVWCFFAAILSFIIYIHLRQETHPQPTAKKSTS
jgi:hypothetical protein